MNKLSACGAVLLLAVGLAAREGEAMTGFDLPRLAAQTARRFPQPVRVGDLIGRRLLEPHERQATLGRVSGVARRADGGIDLLVALGGWFGPRRLVAVPSEATALLGEHVVLVGGTPGDLSALPTATEPRGVSPDETVRMGLTKPFH